MEILTAALQCLIIIPAAILCYLPMGSHLAYSRCRIAALYGAAFLCFLPVAVIITIFFNTGGNAVLIPALLLFFFLYRRTLDAPLPKTLAVYFFVCSLMSFACILSFAFDAWLHPYSGYADFSWQAGVFQTAASVLLLICFAYPFRKYFRSLIDRPGLEKVWYVTLPVSGIFLVLNILFIPHSYQTLHVNRIFPVFLTLLCGLFAFLLFFCILFYRTVSLMLDYAAKEEHNRFLEQQAEQYVTLHNHMEQTRRLRHDFRHFVHALSGLAEQGDLDSVKLYLRTYEQEQAAVLDMVRPFCKNAALNALFGHYMAMAQEAGIVTDWKIALPEPLTISELDLLSLLGNLLENAVAGCRTVPENQRRFSLSIQTMEADSLYIVSSNSFDGHLVKESGNLRSSKGYGHGIGLYSIRTLAEKYDGMAQFSNTDTEFCMDVVLKL